MISRVSLRNAILIAYMALFLCQFFGLRFYSPLLNYAAEIIVWTLIPYFAYYVFTIKTSSKWTKSTKYVIGTLFGVLSLGLPILFLLIALQMHSIAMDWNGKDLSNEEIHRTPVGNGIYVVAYRTNGGATTDFGVNIYTERELGFGLKKVRFIDGIYHAYDIAIERIDDTSFQIKITFTDDGHGSDYYRDGGMLKDGDILRI